MEKQNPFLSPEAHKFLGIEFNMKVWELLGNESRSDEDDQSMIHAAHASHYHWTYVGSAVHHTRGEWLISHVYSILGRPEPALYHAARCLKICRDHNIRDFDLAYAYESKARALAANDELKEASKYYTLAQGAGILISDAETKNLFRKDFEAGPWNGLK